MIFLRNYLTSGDSAFVYLKFDFHLFSESEHGVQNTNPLFFSFLLFVQWIDVLSPIFFNLLNVATEYWLTFFQVPGYDESTRVENESIRIMEIIFELNEIELDAQK